MVQNEVARFFMAHVVQRNDKEAPEFMARPAALHPISASALAIANIRCTAAAALVGRLVIRYGQTRAQKLAKSTNREHWIQRITFAAETNAACSRGSSDITHTHTHTHTHRRSASQYLLRWLTSPAYTVNGTAPQYLVAHCVLHSANTLHVNNALHSIRRNCIMSG